MNIGAEYIKYRWKAKRRHGIHSPFVYDFTDVCLRLPVSAELSTRLKKIERLYKKNKKTIEIEDFGAGSKRLGITRSLHSIYRTSSSKGKFGIFLHQLVQHYKPKHVLELGTSLGVGTTCLATGNSTSKVTTVEGCPQTFAEASHLDELPNVTRLNQQFNDYIATLVQEKFDLIFIDGHHDGDALMRYIQLLKPFCTNETIFVLDDIRWSNSMLDAWNTIQADPSFNVSIDLFRMGIITPRKQQERESFVIRL